MPHHNHPVCNVVLPGHIAWVVQLTKWRGNLRKMLVLYINTGNLSMAVPPNPFILLKCLTTRE